VNSFISWLPRVVGTPVAINVDGLEWQRAKWNQLAKKVYRISEVLATILPNHVVTDSEVIQAYYRRRFRTDSTFIPYGAPVQRVETDEILKKLDLRSRDYVLYVSRLEPENNAHLVVQAFERVKTNKKLVIVGDAPYSESYIAELKNTKDPRIEFTGYVFGEGYSELQSHAYMYIQATEVGGTHPALLEGMGYGNCVLANDVPEHREVLGTAGCYYRGGGIDDLTEKMQDLLDHPKRVKAHRAQSVERIEERYTWERIIDRYEHLFFRLVRRGFG
jgi:glycosyltransferase involved in cell wall biosynthesis